MQMVFIMLAIGVIIGVYVSFRQMNKKIKSEMVMFNEFGENLNKKEE